MKQVWSRHDLLVGVDKYDNPYLAEYHLLISHDEFELELYTQHGLMNADDCEGIPSSMVSGMLFHVNLTIFEDDSGVLCRFSNVRDYNTQSTASAGSSIGN